MAEPIDEYFTTTIAAMTGPALGNQSALTVPNAMALFDAQLGSRHLDLAARWLRSIGKGYYTIGSSGHEGNAAVAAALRPSDPALLHYRSGGFFLARAQQVGGRDALRDVLLGLVAATEEPIAGGRHKVFGRHDLSIIPQTSTIASHLPRAVGVAFSIARARKLGVACPWPADAVTVCSFGDASANHSTAVGAINAALYSAYQGLPMPLLFVCEDNEIGISTKTARGWVARTYGQREGLEYFAADGSDLPATFDATAAAAAWVRTHRRPAFLHLRMVRLMGHAGSDYEPAYRRPDEIAADFDRDPVLCTAKLLITHGHLTPTEVLDRYEAKRVEVIELARDVSELPQLDSAPAVMKPLQESIDEAKAVSVSPTSDHVSRQESAIDGGAGHQPRARGQRAPLPGGADLRGRHRPQGRCLRRYPRTARQVRFGAGVRHAAGRAGHPRARPGRRQYRVCCPYRRSSTSPIFTTPPTRFGARAPPCSSSPTANTATRWWSESPVTDTRRGSAGTSTTTTPSPPSATSPAS